MRRGRHTIGLRGGALLVALALFLASPFLAVASAAAEPISLGEWMSAIFATADRKVDPSQQGIGGTAPPPPAPVVQSSGEPAPPQQPLASAEVVRLWVRRDGSRRRRRR
jgi:hypothetical protein